MFNEALLSPYEAKLVSDSAILYAKNNIIKKVQYLFSAVSDQYVREASVKLPTGVTSVAPKISRGEQYLGLPYLMLDYPRNFSKENTFAIRSFFWWGHFFSIHLQLSGAYQQQFAPALIKAIGNGELNGWFIGIHENEWHHHFEEDNYQCISNGTIDVDLLTSPFIKLAKKIPLNEWDNVQTFLTANFIKLLNVISV